MTKNESKLLSIQGIAKASAFCLLLSAFSVNAAMAAPAPAGTVDEVMAVQQGKKVTGVVVDGTGEPVIGANVVVKGTTNGTITDFDGNYTIEGVPADGVLVISYIGMQGIGKVECCRTLRKCLDIPFRCKDEDFRSKQV